MTGVNHSPPRYGLEPLPFPGNHYAVEKSAGHTDQRRKTSVSHIRHSAITTPQSPCKAIFLSSHVTNNLCSNLFQGSSVCQVTSIGVTVILLYTSRACYNLFILSFSQTKKVNSFDYDWYNVSDQASMKIFANEKNSFTCNSWFPKHYDKRH